MISKPLTRARKGCMKHCVCTVFELTCCKQTLIFTDGRVRQGDAVLLVVFVAIVMVESGRGRENADLFNANASPIKTIVFATQTRLNTYRMSLTINTHRPTNHTTILGANLQGDPTRLKCLILLRRGDSCLSLSSHVFRSRQTHLSVCAKKPRSQSVLCVPYSPTFVQNGPVSFSNDLKFEEIRK